MYICNRQRKHQSKTQKSRRAFFKQIILQFQLKLHFNGFAYIDYLKHFIDFLMQFPLLVSKLMSDILVGLIVVCWDKNAWNVLKRKNVQRNFQNFL